jgi:transcriptional regulator NrdR family protein
MPEADDNRGIRCPKCNCGHCPEMEKPFETAETHPLGPRFSVRRVRKCRNCGQRFNTYERAAVNTGME